jgi:DNA-binding FrmR family transcriptional regulator
MPISDADRDDIASRLSRIEGQIRGLKRMVEEDRYCGDILDQIHSVQ